MIGTLENFYRRIHALITSEDYNSVKFFREEVDDFDETFASVDDGGFLADD